MHVPRVEVKFIFRDGGHSDFQAKFEWLKERLNHAQELGLIPAQNLEPPPPYEFNTAEPSSSGASGNTQAGTPQQQRQQQPQRQEQRGQQPQQQQQQQPPQPAPDEPPPDYVEAQTQAISIQYEERMREEAERQ